MTLNMPEQFFIDHLFAGLGDENYNVTSAPTLAVDFSALFKDTGLKENSDMYKPSMHPIGEDFGCCLGFTQDTVWESSCPEIADVDTERRLIQRTTTPTGEETVSSVPSVFRSSRELLQVVRDALEPEACNKTETFYEPRDIMLGHDVADTLELGDRERADRERLPRAYRTGTWQFLSIKALKDTTIPSTLTMTIHDDVECTFWTFYYACIHFFTFAYTSSHWPYTTNPSVHFKLFDEQGIAYHNEQGVRHHVRVGGTKKHVALLDREVRDVHFDCKPLGRVVHAFADVLDRVQFRRYELMFLESRSKRKAEGEEEGTKEEVDLIESLLADVKSNSTEAKFVEEVEDFIQMIDREVASAGDWPKGDDAVEDQYPTQAAADIWEEMVESEEESFMPAASSCSGSPQPESPGTLSREGTSECSSDSDGASSCAGEHPHTADEDCVSGSLALGLPIVAGVKRARNDYDEDREDVQDGAGDRQVKRARKSGELEAVVGRTGLAGLFVRALKRGVSKVFKRRRV